MHHVNLQEEVERHADQLMKVIAHLTLLKE